MKSSTESSLKPHQETQNQVQYSEHAKKIPHKNHRLQTNFAQKVILNYPIFLLSISKEDSNVSKLNKKMKKMLRIITKEFQCNYNLTQSWCIIKSKILVRRKPLFNISELIFGLAS